MSAAPLHDPRASLWVTANAGCGKTHILVERLLFLLLTCPPPARILCLTFTRAAAGEMLERISGRLAKWQLMPQAQLRRELAQLGCADAGAALLPRARSLFARVLESVDTMRVQTIHSFCASLLRRFPLEAGVPPSFRVSGEDEARLARRQTLARFYAQLASGLDEGAAGAQADMARFAGTAGRAVMEVMLDRIEAEREAFANLWQQENWQDELAELLAAEKNQTEETILAEIAAQCPQEKLAQARDILAAGSITDQRAAERIGQIFLPGGEQDYLLAFFTRQQEPRKNLATKRSLAAEPVMAAEQERLIGILTRAAAQRVYQDSLLLAQAGRQAASLHQRARLESGLLDYEDLILRAASLLTDRAASDWVRYKLDGGIDHVLVDEAQDTSAAHWKVIAALAQEFYAGAGSAQRSRTFFAVGDPKQSIFSFQGADARLFAGQHARFASLAQNGGRPWHDLLLTRSYRSLPLVLRAVDKVFTDPDLAQGVTDKKPLRHQSARPRREHRQARVEIWPVCDSESSAAEEEAWTLPSASRADEIWRAPIGQCARQLARKIAELCAGGEKAENIIVLVRRRGTFSRLLTLALHNENLPAAGADRMKLADHLAVMDVMALGRFVLLPEDDLNLAALLKSPLCQLDEDALMELALKRGQHSLWHALGQRTEEIYVRAHQWLSARRAFADQKGVYDFFADALAAAGGRRALIAAFGVDAVQPLAEFLDLALEYDHRQPSSLEHFLSWLHDSGHEMKRQADQRGGVNVMTMHAAKGLEAKVVFLACLPAHRHPARLYFAGQNNLLPLFVRQRSPYEPDCVVQARTREDRLAEEEGNRLLYVALTRARDQIYLCGFEDGKKARPGWLDAIADRLPFCAAPPPDLAEPPPLKPPPVLSAGAPPPETPPPVQAEASPLLHIAPSSFGRRLPSSLLAPVSDAAKRGVIIHEILRFAPGLPPAQWQAKAKRFLALPQHNYPPAGQNELLAEAAALLAEKEFAPFWQNASSEAPLAGIVPLNGRPVHISAQLDLLAAPDEGPDKGLVRFADYKTSQHPPQTLPPPSSAEMRQMALYHLLLAALYPGRALIAALVWTHAPRLMILPPGHIAAAQKILPEAIGTQDETPYI